MDFLRASRFRKNGLPEDGSPECIAICEAIVALLPTASNIRELQLLIEQQHAGIKVPGRVMSRGLGYVCVTV